jgi:hypothetical protein
MRSLHLGKIGRIYGKTLCNAINILFSTPVKQIKQMLMGYANRCGKLGHAPRLLSGAIVIQKNFLDFEI